MVRVEERQFFAGHRFLVRVRGRTGKDAPWWVLPVAKLQSVEGGLLVSSGAGPGHPLLQTLVEVSSTRRTVGMGPSRSQFAEIEIWRVARGTANAPAVLLGESYEFECYEERPYDLDAMSSGVSLEHALLKGLRLLQTTRYEAAQLPPELPEEVRALARSVLSEVPKEPGDYRVFFRNDGGAFTLEGSECVLRLESTETQDAVMRFRVLVFLGSVELPSTGNRQFDVMQREGGREHDAVLSVEGESLAQVVAEALYLTRIRTARVIESIVRA